MGTVSLLQQLYRQRAPRTGSRSPLASLVSAHLDGRPLDETLLDEAAESLLPALQGGEHSSPLGALEPRRQLLALLLMLQDTGRLADMRARFKERAAPLKQPAAWPTFQLAAMYQGVIELLLEQHPQEPRPLVKRYQLPSGAALLEPGGYWPWAQIPHPRFHAELGVLWSVYFHLTGDESYLQAAQQLAGWHCHTLDHNYAPFVGLFSSEEDVTESSLLINNVLLFDAAGARGQLPFAGLAARQREHLHRLSLHSFVDVPPHAAVLEKWLSKYSPPASSPAADVPLPTIEDRSLALVGCRFGSSSAVSTLFGGGTGMGCLHAGDVQVVSYGPQHAAILGDCRGFGLEGSQRLLQAHPQTIEAKSSSYRIEGMSRVVPQPRETPSPALFRVGEPSGFWMESKQVFDAGKLSIDARFYGVRDTSELAFVFFAKAKNCVVGAGRLVKPRSLDRYRGGVCPLVLQSGLSTLHIAPSCAVGEMQVIPLGGEGAFWGADFLVAFLFDAGTSRYGWDLSP